MDIVDKYLNKEKVQISEAFDWDLYAKEMEKIHKSNIKITYKDIFQKGKKSLMGPVKAAKINLEKIKNIGDEKTIELYRF